MSTIQISDELLDWYNGKPEIIQKAVLATPPNRLYRFKDSKKQCYIVSYEEPENESEKVTLTVQKTGVGGAMSAMGLGALDKNQVFGVDPENLEPYE